MSKHVFLSYSRADTDFGLKLKADIEDAGYGVWMDTSTIKGGDEWVEAITQGVNDCVIMLSVVSPSASSSKWVRREFLFAENKEKHIVPIWAVECELPIYMVDLNAIKGYGEHYDAMLERVLSVLQGEQAPLLESQPSQRALEIAYLDRLWLQHKVWIETYTPMAGVAHLEVESRGPIIKRATVRIDTKYNPLSKFSEMLDEIFVPKSEIEMSFEDITRSVQTAKYLVILGEPGAGKTTTLWKLTADYANKAREDSRALLPILLSLGALSPEVSVTSQIQSQLGNIKFDDLIEEGRVALFIDALNELPMQYRTHKVGQILEIIDRIRKINREKEDVYSKKLEYVQELEDRTRKLENRIKKLKPNKDLKTRIRKLKCVKNLRTRIKKQNFIKKLAEKSLPLYMVVATTSRRHDYVGDIDLDISYRVEIAPLDPIRILNFCRNYLPEDGEKLFWDLAGNEIKRAWVNHKESFARFWDGATLNEPQELRNLKEAMQGKGNSRLMLVLARNPYMLYMITEVYARTGGKLPPNRGKLFELFVDFLMRKREQLDEEVAETLSRNLSNLAYQIQHQKLGTSVKRNIILNYLDEHQLYHALSANLLDGTNEIRFTHQLLQEYFAAKRLDREMKAGTPATDFWQPENWWSPTGWEETAILLAGLYSDDTTPVIDWLGMVNPALAVRCILESGAHTPQITVKRYQPSWLVRMVDVDHEPNPYARGAIGWSIGLLDLDNREGVGLLRNGVPDIAWVEIPDDEFIDTEGRKKISSGFFVSRYPVTHAQFQSFIDAKDGYHNSEWWSDLSARKTDRQLRQQTFNFWNHPRDTVNWYQAIAFCRWLSSKLGYEVSLPTETQWEKAARGAEGLMYPWGDEFDSSKCNWGELGIDQSVAVGIFPQGASPYGVLDLVGNVWEWCLNEYGSRQKIQLGGSNTRALRGGSWRVRSTEFLRTTDRLRGNPSIGLPIEGFRVMAYSINT